MVRRLFLTVSIVALSLHGVTEAQIVADGGFELGSPNPVWEESSTNFDSPICDTQRCGSFFGDPFDGTHWAWFGGATMLEVGSLSQTVTIPPGTATLSFQLDITAASGNGVDFLSVFLDGVELFTVLESDMTTHHPWTQVDVDISGFADGGPHVLSFESTVTGPMRSNFWVDAVEIAVETALPGDLNCDGAFDGADIDPFFLALGDPNAYDLAFPDCDRMLADMNGDNAVDGADIDAFFDCLGGGECP